MVQLETNGSVGDRLTQGVQPIYASGEHIGFGLFHTCMYVCMGMEISS